VKNDSTEDVNIMEIGKRYIVAGVSGAIVYSILWHAPFMFVMGGMQVAVEAAMPALFTLAIGIGIGAVSRGK